MWPSLGKAVFQTLKPNHHIRSRKVDNVIATVEHVHLEQPFHMI